MNDYLLESQKIKRDPVSLEVDDQRGKTSNSAMQVSTVPMENSTAFKILMQDRQAKVNITFNTLFMILILNIFPLLAFISTYPNLNWFLMVETQKYDYWSNFLFIKKECNSLSELQTASQFCSEAEVTVYFHFLLKFYWNGCKDGQLTLDDPSNLCSVVASYTYSGLIGCIATLLGILIHSVYIYQLAKLSYRRNLSRLKGFSILTILYSTLFFYTGSLLYWLFASATFINKNSKKALGDRFGSSFFCYIGALIASVILTLWFRRVYKKGERKNFVNYLLDAERKYIHNFQAQRPPDEA